jgi:hypothetical protein
MAGGMYFPKLRKNNSKWPEVKTLFILDLSLTKFV